MNVEREGCNNFVIKIPIKQIEDTIRKNIQKSNATFENKDIFITNLYE